MMTTTDLTCGVKINDWTLIKKHDQIHWICRCECGVEKKVVKYGLINNISKRCRSCATKKAPRPIGLKTAQNLKDKKFGRWLVIEKAPSKAGRSVWVCACTCGKRFNRTAQTLLNGDSTGCRECFTVKGKKRNGLGEGRYSPEYNTWSGMKDRCLNSKCKDWKNYGGRGISICDEWKVSFQEFYKCVGAKPFKDASLDRINNDGNYEPGNVRWATQKQQKANTRKQKYGVCISHWSRENNKNRIHVSKRLKEGMSLEEIKECVKQPYKERKKIKIKPK